MTLVGVILFLAVIGFSNLVLQRQYNLSYSSHPVVFCALYGVVTVTVLAFVLLLSDLITVSLYDGYIVCIAGVMYGMCGRMWNWVQRDDINPAVFQVPLLAQISFRFTSKGQLTKVAEICFQQSCSLLVILGLHQFGFGLLAITVAFMVIAFTVHLPSVRLYGPLFGWFFIWSATGFACVAPYLFLYQINGFALMVLLHTSVYVWWYSYLIYTQQYKAKARE